MQFRPVYHHEIPDDLVHIPANIKERIRKAIETRLLADPSHFGLPLRRNLKSYWKLRVGDYRVIYRIDDKDVIIYKIGHRKDVYPKVLARLNKP